ncbi:MAG TPA: HPr(Ser) kinase/phosphatase [Gemmatimonadota bacterium]|nr:HPr(Ser) kinase/phosphatase [Gemmatimonadota bacterium]
MSVLTVGELLERKSDSLSLELLAGSSGLEREVPGPEISSPGLVLSGFTDRFPRDRIQVLGETEVTYLRSLSAGERSRAVETLIGFRVPCLVVTKGLEPPAELVAAAERTDTPVVGTRLKTGEFYRRIKPYLEEEFAPRTAVHGSVADVYGVGLLFVGKSGIGKSECVLDLVERGHRLVADDVVLITRRGNDVLIGRGHELAQHHMEIRGIGIIDIRALFGVRATRQQKRVEVVVQLEEWSDTHAYDRTGLDADTAEILGVRLPRVVIPLNPGKNITVISEVIAMNHLLKYSGVDTARAFDQKLRKSMRPVREYLEEDNE